MVTHVHDGQRFCHERGLHNWEALSPHCTLGGEGSHAVPQTVLRLTPLQLRGPASPATVPLGLGAALTVQKSQDAGVRARARQPTCHVASGSDLTSLTPSCGEAPAPFLAVSQRRR